MLAGSSKLVAGLRKLEPRLVVVEATGGLQRQVVAALWAAQNSGGSSQSGLGPPLRQGPRGKTDRIDADLLAL